MEAQSLNTILDKVKEALANSTSVADPRSQHNSKTATSNAAILPKNIPALPQDALLLPEHTLPLNRAIDRLTQHILPYLSASSLSSRYYGFVTGGVTPAALIGDILASIFDQNNAVYLPNESISTNVEVAALNMLVDLFQLPKDDWAIGTSGDGGGVFTTGATATNILGLALGREYGLQRRVKSVTGMDMSVGEHGLLALAIAGDVDSVKVLSTLPHSSVAKAAGVLGIGRANVVSIIKKGTVMDVDVEKLESLIENGERARTVYILAISAGEVNTGHFATGSGDVMEKVRSICDRYSVWVHVDGAMGLFARTLIGCQRMHDYEQLINGVKGLELADSIGTDGHKLLNVPYDCGIFFTKHKKLSEQVFSNGNAAYLTSTTEDETQSPLNIGLENSRRLRALPVYATLSAYGREGYVDMLERQIGLSRKVAAWLDASEYYEVLPTYSTENKKEMLAKTFMIVLFRAKDDQVNENLVTKIKANGRIYVSGSVWDHKPACRLAVSNWRVNIDEDFPIIEDVLEKVAQP